MKTIGMVGARSRDEPHDIQLCVAKFFELYEKGDKIVSGGCRKGGDRFAEIIAEKYDIPIKLHYPEWDKHGKAAGFIRNTNIAEDADVIIACVASDRKGGTEDTIKKAEKLNKRVEIV